MAQGNFFLDNNDIRFHVENLNFNDLFDLVPQEAREAVSAESGAEYMQVWLEVVKTFGEICTSIAEKAREVEEAPLTLENGEVVLPAVMVEHIRNLKEFGLPALTVSAKWGGMAAPFLCEMVGAEMLNRACPSTMLNVGWYGNIARIIEEYGSEEIQAKYVPKIASGEYSGNMSLTEPDAGSDLASLTTYAVKQKNGTYKLYGTKRFISNGNSEIGLILAKTKKGAQGLDFLSLFVCPRKIDGQANYTISKIEEKIGLHGSATCELVFDGAKAELLGEEDQGYNIMLRLMNDSRIGVGFQGIGLMEAALRQAREYAEARHAWGKAIAKHELIAEKLLDMEVELAATRSLGIKAAYHRSIMYLAEAKVAQEPEYEAVLEHHTQIVRRFTPLLKFWVGEVAPVHARNVMQILGGYGYTTEYRAEWLMRESLIYSVYEGTSQIQALMCLKDTMKNVIKSPTEFIQKLIGSSYRTFVTRNGVERRVHEIEQLLFKSILTLLIRLAKVNLKATFTGTNRRDLVAMLRVLRREFGQFENFQPAMIHAERIAWMSSYLAMAECVVEDARKDPSREWIAERFVHNALLKVKYHKSEIDDPDAILEENLTSNTVRSLSMGGADESQVAN